MYLFQYDDSKSPAKSPTMESHSGDEGKFTLVSLPSNSTNKKSSDLKRHGSLIGILPSGIGIGSGAVLTGDEEMLEELAAKRRQHSDFRASFKKS